MRSAFRLFVTIAVLVAAQAASQAQAVYAGYGPGSYISIGGTVSAYKSDYGKRLLGGSTVFVDANLYRRWGVEARANFLNLNTDEGVKERTYLVGPKLSLRGKTFRPYGKFLVGRGELDFPFGYGHGSYFVMAPGGGLDWRVARSRFMVRLVDVEYQVWPGFSFGTLKPYGISTGLSVTVRGFHPNR